MRILVDRFRKGPILIRSGVRSATAYLEARSVNRSLSTHRSRFSLKGTIPTLLALLTVALLTATGCSGGSTKGADFYSQCMSGSITVWGEAPIFASKAAARKKAKEDACRTAVGKCIGDQIASRSGVADGQSITSEIFSDARGLCRNDSLLEEQEYMLDTVKMLKVFMRYEVSRSALTERIDTMQQMVGNPRIMVLIREEYNLAGQGKKVYSFTSGQTKSAALLREFLASRGYTVVDPGKARYRGLNEEIASRNPDSVPASLKDRAAAAGADILIIGSVETNAQSVSSLAGTDFRSYNATGNVSILALWGEGRVIGEYNEPASGAHVADITAAQSAVQRYTVGSSQNWSENPGGLARFVHSRLSDEWSRITQNNVIRLEVEGLDQNLAGVFRDDLQERTAVKKVDEISFSGNKSVWDVTYPGRSFALADTLSFYAENPRMFLVIRDSGKKIAVESVKRGHIRIVFR